MDVRQTLEKHGFEISGSGGGCEWYVKKIRYKGEESFIAITDEDGCGVPESLDQSVLVGIYNMDGEELEEAKKYDSLRTFLAEGNLA